MARRKAIVAILGIITITGIIVLIIGSRALTAESRSDVKAYNVGAVKGHPVVIVRSVSKGLYQCVKNDAAGLQVRGFGCREL